MVHQANEYLCESTRERAPTTRGEGHERAADGFDSIKLLDLGQVQIRPVQSRQHLAIAQL